MKEKEKLTTTKWREQGGNSHRGLSQKWVLRRTYVLEKHHAPLLFMQ